MSNWTLSIENWLNSILFPVYEKTIDGADWMFVDGDDNFSKERENLNFALKHPILTPAILFVSNLFAQAHFKVVDRETGVEKKNHWLLKLLENPNYIQTQITLLEQLQFLKISQGKGVIHLKRAIGVEDIDSIFILRSDLITFPEGFNTKSLFKSRSEKFLKTKIIYDQDGKDEKEIMLKDLIFLHDLPPIIQADNMLENNSRIDGLQQTLKNTYDSLVAKNIILKSNGKEMLSGGSGTGFPFSKEDQDEAKSLWNSNYGLGFGRSRVYMTTANVNWKSLHTALRDLGLDESVKVDGNLIYTALHIPKDILSLEAKKTTYNNFKESMTSYIQNDIQAQANDLAVALTKLVDENEKVVASYDHLPVMKFLEKTRFEAANLRVTALANARRSGLSDEDSLELVGLPKTMKLNPLINETQKETGENSTEQSDNDREENQED